MSLNKPTTLTLCALFVVFSLTTLVRAAGELDTGFNAAAFGISNGTAYVVKKQADGKILVGGYFSAANGTAAPALVRLNLDGSVDSSFTVQNLFNSLGIGASVWSIAVQGDGKILIGGHFLTSTGVAQPGVRRLNPDGSLDAGFTPFIVVSGSAIYDIEILPDGRIIAGGLFSGPNLPNNIVRLEANGTWDPGFASLSGFGVKDMELQSDGKLIVVGWDPSTTTVTGDFDGDGKSDLAIYRPSTGDWWWMSSIDSSQRATHFGISTDTPTAADFDGDGKTDFAVYRASTGTWYILNSGNGQVTITNFGLAEDKPVAADYDGDGRADIAVFRPSTGVWYQLRSTS